MDKKLRNYRHAKDPWNARKESPLASHTGNAHEGATPIRLTACGTFSALALRPTTTRKCDTISGTFWGRDQIMPEFLAHFRVVVESHGGSQESVEEARVGVLPYTWKYTKVTQK